MLSFISLNRSVRLEGFLGWTAPLGGRRGPRGLLIQRWSFSLFPAVITFIVIVIIIIMFVRGKLQKSIRHGFCLPEILKNLDM